MPVLPFTQQMQVHECHVRGVYLSIACDYEQLMEDVIALCESDQVSRPINNGSIKRYCIKYLTHLTMGKKLGRLSKKLKAYNEEYFNSLSEQFKIMDKLVEYRNILAHGYSNYDEKQLDTSFIIFEHVDKGKLNTSNVSIKPFLLAYEHYRQCLNKLMELTVAMRAEIYHKGASGAVQ